jgi:hypothetical protein
MDNHADCSPSGLSLYKPTAIYYDEADSLEYIRRDEPAVYRRVDELLTLIISMKTREPIGFRLKGFRYLYLKHLKGKLRQDDSDFPRLVQVFEHAMGMVGDKVFEEERRVAYTTAREIAETDDVRLSQVPEAA